VLRVCYGIFVSRMHLKHLKYIVFSIPYLFDPQDLRWENDKNLQALTNG
jgi:hypothetical protein